MENLHSNLALNAFRESGAKAYVPVDFNPLPTAWTCAAISDTFMGQTSNGKKGVLVVRVIQKRMPNVR